MFQTYESLDKLSDDQLRDYYQAACQYLGIPANLNLLYFKNVDGQKVLVFKRGAAEIWRENHPISVEDSVRMPDEADSVVWKSVGTNGKGRREVAIGSCSAHGIFGKDKSNVVMAAHSKSLMRLTAQFMGGGFLWEDEVPDAKSIKLVETSPVIQQIAQVAQPTVAPAAQPGKDITEQALETLHEGLLPTGKRIYKKRGEIDLNSDISPGVITHSDKEFIPKDTDGIIQPVVTNVSLNEPVPGQMPNSTELRAFKKRGAAMIDTLKEGGMKPSEGVGGLHEKMNLYMKKQFPQMTSVNDLTNQEWSAILDPLDKMNETFGPENVVNHINDAVGG